MNKENKKISAGKEVKMAYDKGELDIAPFADQLSKISEEERLRLHEIIERHPAALTTPIEKVVENEELRSRLDDFSFYLDTISEKVIDEGNAILIKINGEPAAIGGYYLWGENEKGEEIYMISTVATLPGHKRKGLSKQVIQAAFDKIRIDHPESPILLISKNELTQRQCDPNRPEWKERDAKWDEITMRRMSELLGRKDEKRTFTDEEIRREEENGYKTFICPSNKLKNLTKSNL